MAAFKNGEAKTSQLKKTASGFYLATAAAESWDRLAAAFYAETGFVLAISGAYRALNDPWKYSQEALFTERYRVQWVGSGPFGDVRWWNKKRYVRYQGAAAAIPSQSNHGWGLAVDISTSRVMLGKFDGVHYKWLDKNAPKYGWDNKAGKKIGEAWHWEYVEKNDTKRGDLYEITTAVLNVRKKASTAGKPAKQVKKGQRVRFVRYANGGGYRWGVTHAGYFYAIRVTKTGVTYARKV